MKRLLVMILIFASLSITVFAEEKDEVGPLKPVGTTSNFSWGTPILCSFFGGLVGLSAAEIYAAYKNATRDDKTKAYTAGGGSFVLGAGIGLIYGIIIESNKSKSQSIVEFKNRKIIFDVPIVQVKGNEFNANIFSMEF